MQARAWKVLLPVVGIVAVATVALVLLRAGSGRPTGSPPASTAGGDLPKVAVAEGAVLPDLTLVPFKEGADRRLSSLGAKVIVLNFWATWCTPCMTEMPTLVKLRQTYASRGLEVIPLNVDENAQKVIPRAAERLGIDFPIYVDRDQKLSEYFDISGIPVTIVLDGNRRILHVERGEFDWFSDDFRKKVEGWLSG
jgi:thiol-disulfide isomerase/thioredoxin